MNIEAIRVRVYELHAEDQTGHDILHLERVEKNLYEIAEGMTGVDIDVAVATVLLHEVFDHKLSLNVSQEEVVNWLTESGADSRQVDNVLHSISYLSYSVNQERVHTLSIEGQVVQDADRLDAMGAIGIARAFHYGGYKGQPIYRQGDLLEYKEDSPASSFKHFYDKLFKLREAFNTERGRELAQQRHEFMDHYIEVLKREID